MAKKKDSDPLPVAAPMEIIDAATEDGEADPNECMALVPIAAPMGALNPFGGASTLTLSEQEMAALAEPVRPEQIKVRPDGGMIYLPGMRYRQKLRQVFGPGQWAIIRRDARIDTNDNMVYYDGILMVRGHYVAEEIGEQEYFPDNPTMSYATALAAARTNCIMRCVATSLGYSEELWDPDFSKDFLARYAVKAWCVNLKSPDKRRRNEKEAQYLWRLKTDPPIDQWPWKEEVKGERPQGNPHPPKGQPAREAPPKSWTPDQLAVRQDVQRTIIEKLEYLKGLNEPRPQPPASMKGAAPKTLADSQIPTDDLQAYDITLHESLMACAKGIAEELADDDLYQLVGTGSPRQVYELAAKLVKERV